MNLPMIFVDGAAILTVIACDFFVVSIGICVFSLGRGVETFPTVGFTVECVVTDLGVVVEFVTALQTIKTFAKNAITVNNFIAIGAPRCATQ